MALLADRFEILDEIGRGAQAVTYRAMDHDTGEVVALKELDFRRVEDWKSQELFEREGQTLQGIDHPAIPRYVAAFAVEDADSVRLFLAQEFVEGKTLAEELRDGRRWSVAELIADATQLLDALAFLHARHPPIVHRDIKPSNLIRRADGTIAMVDFGAAQNALPRTVGGSTVIGTPGYMPMEQLMGRAVPGTDLYAFGATLVHLLTATEPSALPVERNRVVWRDRVSVGPVLEQLIESLLEPSVEDRPRDADEVRTRLRAILEADTLPPRGVPEDLPVVWDEPHDEIALAGARTLDFPRWTVAVPGENGEFFMDFETWDEEERRVKVEIVDRRDGLVVKVWDKGAIQYERDGRIGWGVLVVSCVLIPLWFMPNLMPLGVVAAMALVARRIMRETEVEPKPDILLELDRQHLRLEREGEFRITTPISGLKWRREDDLLLVTADREVPVVGFSKLDAQVMSWFQRYLPTRAREIAAQGAVLALGEASTERGEFWKDRPVDAAQTLPATVAVDE